MRRRIRLPKEVMPTKKTRRKIDRDRKRTIPNPERKDLTFAEWRDRGDWIKALKRYNYVGAMELSYLDCKDAYESLQICSKFRVMHTH